jgi:hypothetical protein
MSLFLYLSKTDPNLIKAMIEEDEVTGRDAKLAQSSLGLSVFITGVLAFTSGSYAMYTTFENWKIALGIGFIYACMIMAFDREIVSSTDRRAILMRFPLAILIGISVAVPLEIRLLQGRIDSQLDDENREKNKLDLDRMRGLLDKFRERTAELEKEIDNYRRQINTSDELIRREKVGEPGDPIIGTTTEMKGCGPACQASEKKKENTILLLKSAEEKLKKHLEGENKNTEEANTGYALHHSKKSYDFLSRFVALESLKSDPKVGTSVWYISWALRILFMMFEIFPAVIKLFIPENRYTERVETARRIALHMLNRSANYEMSKSDPPHAYPPPPFDRAQKNQHPPQSNLTGSTT